MNLQEQLGIVRCPCGLCLREALDLSLAPLSAATDTWRSGFREAGYAAWKEATPVFRAVYRGVGAWTLR